jgi:hypothetical protein
LEDGKTGKSKSPEDQKTESPKVWNITHNS